MSVKPCHFGGAPFAPAWVASSSFALPSGVTLSRSGTALALQGSSFAAATYASVSANTGRWERLPDGSVGWLIEGARTNLLLQCSALDNASWGNDTGPTVSANDATSPDGTSDADTITTTSSSGGWRTQAVSLTDAVAYCMSGWMKQGSWTEGQVYISGGWAAGSDMWVNLNPSTGGFNHDVRTTNKLGTLIGNGWGRLSFIGTKSGSTSATYEIGVDGATTPPSSIHFWNAQLEAGAFPSSPIPTTTATVTRNAETATDTASSTSGGFALYLKARTALGTSGTQVLRQVDDGTTSNRVTISRNSSGHIVVDVVSGGVSQASLDLGAVADGTVFKVAVRVAANNFGASLNGGVVVADTSGSVPSGMTTDRWGHDTSGSQWFGHILEADGWGSTWRSASTTDAQLRAWST